MLESGKRTQFQNSRGSLTYFTYDDTKQYDQFMNNYTQYIINVCKCVYAH